MTDQARSTLFNAHREAQRRFTYFLLAGAWSALGFTLIRTEAEPLAWHHLPVGVAILSWALSIVAGLARERTAIAAIGANMSLLDVQAGIHPDLRHPGEAEPAESGIRDALNKHSDAASWWQITQMVLLLLGAVAYIAGHIMEMYQLTGSGGA